MTTHHTSAQAAASIAPVAPMLRDQVHAYVLSQGLRGATAYEIERATGLSGNTVRPRLVELRGDKERGLPVRITTMGELRETGSGRKALAWIAVEP